MIPSIKLSTQSIEAATFLASLPSFPHLSPPLPRPPLEPPPSLPPYPAPFAFFPTLFFLCLSLPPLPLDPLPLLRFLNLPGSNNNNNNNNEAIAFASEYLVWALRTSKSQIVTHYGLEQPKIQTAVLGHSLLRSLVRSHHSLVRLLQTARIAPSTALSFAHTLTSLTPSLVGK